MGNKKTSKAVANKAIRIVKYNPQKKCWQLYENGIYKQDVSPDKSYPLTNGQKIYYNSDGTRTICSKGPDLSKVAENLWQVENPQNKGYNPATGKYYPHRTANGNLDVANGIDLDQNPQYKAEAYRGITKERANQIAMQRLSQQRKNVQAMLKKGTERPDTVSPQIIEGLYDLAWQVGSLKKYEKLAHGIGTGDMNQIQEESKVQFKRRDKNGKLLYDKNGEVLQEYDNKGHQFRLYNYFHYKKDGAVPLDRDRSTEGHDKESPVRAPVVYHVKIRKPSSKKAITTEKAK